MTTNLYIGVDGGGTKSIVRVEDESGCLLGREISGPANVRLSPITAWTSIYDALNKIFQSIGISFGSKAYQFHAGIGIAGCEIPEAYQAFIHHAHPFTTLIVVSDSHVACLGAHFGKDGSIIIAGTGVVGYKIENEQITKVGGWGFPHDDEGGGAWLGLEAVRLTLQSLDGRSSASGLTKAIYAFFDEDRNRLIKWATDANSTAFAKLAPFVIEQSQQGDVFAIKILQDAAKAIDRIGFALRAAQQRSGPALPCSLVGGITPFLLPYLGRALTSHLKPSQGTPDEGAIFLIRQYYARLKDKQC